MRIPSPEYDARLRAAPLYAEGASVKYREEYQHPSCPVAEVVCADASQAMREEWARLFVSTPLLSERVRILREALREIAGTSANENSEPDRMADALGEIQGIVHRALEATKEGA